MDWIVDADRLRELETAGIIPRSMACPCGTAQESCENQVLYFLRFFRQISMASIGG